MMWLKKIRRLAIGLGLVILLIFSTYHAVKAVGRRSSDLSDRPVADFSLSDPGTGRVVWFSDFRGRPAVVLIFLGIDCPIGELYLPRLAELYRIWKDRGVVFLGINSNALDRPADVAEHTRKHGVPFPVLKDGNNVVADRLGVERQCEVLILDGARRVCYRGAVDDQYRVGTRKDAPTTPYLADALADVIAGRAVRVPRTPVFGCLIERRTPKDGSPTLPRIRPAPPQVRTALDRIDPPVAVGPVTFAEDVAPILQEKCQGCHRPGQSGPFSLLTFEQTRRHAAMIREVVNDLRMPPWHADPRFGRFGNDRRLTARQRATLVAWVDQGTPRGDLERAPPPRAFPEGWGIGTPDVVIPMAEPFTIPAEGVVPYQRFRVSTGFTDDKWVQAAEVRPGDVAAVHHVFVFVEHHAAPANRKRYGPCLVGYAPGDMPSVFPPGTAKRIPAGSDLLFEIHYTPTGRARTDRTSVGLIFARGPVRHEAVTKGIRPPGPVEDRLRIPPGDTNYEARGSYTVPGPVRLLSLMPHMHLRGKDFRYTVRYPDGRSEVLLFVPAYDFAWQSVYRLAEPKLLPAGARIDCLAHFDNSAGNPANPDPTATVRWGDYTEDEMMIGYIDYYHDGPAAIATRHDEDD